MQETSQNIEIGVLSPLIQIKAGTTTLVSAPITVLNNSKSPINLDISLRAFEPSERNDGSVTFLTEKDTPQETSNFLKTITFQEDKQDIKTLPVGPRQYKTINMLLTTPTTPQDYYFSVIFTAPATKDSSTETVIKQVPGVAANILLSVDSSRHTQGEVSELSTKRFITGGPVVFKIMATNTSDTFSHVSGTLTIYDMFGNKAGLINLQPAIVLANSSRIITANTNSKDIQSSVVWHEKFVTGLYTAKVALSFDKAYTTTAETHFLGIPLLLLFLITILLFVILSIVLKVIKKLNFNQE